MQLFDLHCDSIVKFKQFEADFLYDKTQFSLHGLDQFTRLCQTMAVFIPDHLRGAKAVEYFKVHQQYLKALTEKQKDIAEQADTAADIRRITKAGKCALILAVESGAALGGELDHVDYLAAQGVKMMTLVWNGENELGSGHQTDHGLSAFGREVVKRMEQKHIIVDVSHINDFGFDDVCQIASKPFIATHSNLRSICGHNRNLTERQFTEIVNRKGLVGINLYEAFLTDEGAADIDCVYRHVVRMLELGGEDVIACGSDFDGADIHPTLDTPLLFAGGAEYLLKKGISEPVINKMFFDNALAFFEKNIG